MCQAYGMCDAMCEKKINALKNYFKILFWQVICFILYKALQMSFNYKT